MSTVTRLFPPAGPSIASARERAFLRDVQRMYGATELALGQLAEALNTGDVSRAIEGSRRLLAIGCLLAEAAREVELA